MRRVVGLVLAVALTGWGSAGFSGVSPSTGAQSQSGAKIKAPQQEQEAEPTHEGKTEEKR